MRSKRHCIVVRDLNAPVWSISPTSRVSLDRSPIVDPEFRSSLLSIFCRQWHQLSLVSVVKPLIQRVTIFNQIVSITPTESYLLVHPQRCETGSDKLNCYRCKFRILKYYDRLAGANRLASLSVICIYSAGREGVKAI